MANQRKVAIAIALARQDDLPALKIMIEGAYHGEHARMGWTNDDDLDEDERIAVAGLVSLFLDPDVVILVASSGEDIVGCVVVTDRTDGSAAIDLLCVDPPFQSAGLGARLLAKAEALCTALEAKVARIEVIEHREPLIAWYKRAGYGPTGDRRPFPVPQNPPVHFLVLEKRLAGA